MTIQQLALLLMRLVIHKSTGERKCEVYNKSREMAQFTVATLRKTQTLLPKNVLKNNYLEKFHKIIRKTSKKGQFISQSQLFPTIYRITNLQILWNSQEYTRVTSLSTSTMQWVQQTCNPTRTDSATGALLQILRKIFVMLFSKTSLNKYFCTGRANRDMFKKTVYCNSARNLFKVLQLMANVSIM